MTFFIKNIIELIYGYDITKLFGFYYINDQLKAIFEFHPI